MDKEEQIRRFKAIYSKMWPNGTDMTEQEFVKSMVDLCDPKKMMDDLGDVQLRKARQRSNKIRINKAMQKNTN